MRKIFSLAGAALLLSTASANADWQFTKWGMTPQQVEKASAGSATDATPSEQTEHGNEDGTQRALLKAPYASGDLKFTAYFLFGGDNRLSAVHLALMGDDTGQLTSALVAKYGPPDREIGGSITRAKMWLTDKDNIGYIQRGSPGITQVTGTVIYRPRMNENNSGL